MRKARILRTVAIGALGLVVAGCSTTLQDVPVPGTGVSGETIIINAEFEDALNLAEGATVKVNGINSGKVQEVVAEDFAAVAEMKIRTSAQLRQGATARLRYTTPLGELFVDVTNPVAGADLEADSTLTGRATSTAPTVEDALSQASLLVNGGGLAQLATITEEANTLLGGREDVVKSLLDRSEVFLTEANATTADIDRALVAMASLSRTLQAREDVINRAVREVRPAARVLRENTPGFTRLLAEVDDFAAAADSTVRKTRQQLLRIAQQAGPVLQEFADLGSDYGVSLDQLVRVGSAVDSFVPGDYASISLDLRLDDLSGLADLSAVDDLLELLGLPPLGLEDIPLVNDLLGGVTGTVGGLLGALGGGTQAQQGGKGRQDGKGKGGRNGNADNGGLLGGLANGLGLSGLLGGGR